MLMTTLEMLNEAKKTGKTYIVDSMRYSVNKGFHDSYGRPWDASAFKYLNEVIHLDGWKLLEPKKMTLKEIEEKLGYEIEIVSS